MEGLGESRMEMEGGLARMEMEGGLARMGQGHFGCAGQGDASTGVFGLMSR